MCVTQFKNYCQAFTHKLYNEIKTTDIVQPYPPYKGKQGDLYYCADRKKLKMLADSGNEYAKMDIQN